MGVTQTRCGAGFNVKLLVWLKTEGSFMSLIAGFFRVIIRIIIGVIFGMGAGLALSPLLASFSESSGAIGLLVLIAIGALLCGFAVSIRRAFGRGFLLLGACVFVLPLSTLVLSGVVMNELVNTAASDADKGFAVIGAGLAGEVFVGLAGVIGFFLGGVLLLCGAILSLGGRRDVVIVERK